MRLNSLKALLVSAVVAIMILIAPQDAKAAPGDVTLMHVFKSPIAGKVKAWILIETEEGKYLPNTVTQDDGMQPGWHFRDGEIKLDENIENYELPLGNVPNFFADAYADVAVTQPEGTNTVVVTTDKTIQVQLVDSQNGELIGELETVESSKTIDISGLPVGCKYMLVIKQDIEGFPCVLPAVNICKMP